jgi:hypothetical protein
MSGLHWSIYLPLLLDKFSSAVCQICLDGDGFFVLGSVSVREEALSYLRQFHDLLLR